MTGPQFICTKGKSDQVQAQAPHWVAVRHVMALGAGVTCATREHLAADAAGVTWGGMEA